MSGFLLLSYFFKLYPLLSFRFEPCRRTFRLVGVPATLPFAFLTCERFRQLSIQSNQTFEKLPVSATGVLPRAGFTKLLDESTPFFQCAANTFPVGCSTDESASFSDSTDRITVTLTRCSCSVHRNRDGCRRNTIACFLANLLRKVQNEGSPRTCSRKDKYIRALRYGSFRRTSVVCSMSGRLSLASHNARRTVTFSKMPISCQSVVDMESSEMVITDVGTEDTMASSHRFKTLASITNIFVELDREVNGRVYGRLPFVDQLT